MLLCRKCEPGLTENNILIQEHPFVLIDSGDMYANSIRKITSVLISILT